MSGNTSDDVAVERAERYYDSTDADAFYHQVWGGEDIHVGCYESDDEPIDIASRRTVARMAKLCELDTTAKVLDLGAGYGGAARQIATRYGCSVTCLNLSEVQNRRNRDKTEAAGLSHKIDVVHGAFEQLPFGDASFDVVWSQDAFLHSGQREQVLAEASRVLRPQGVLVFTDPMQADDVPEGALEAVLARIHLSSLGSFREYEQMAARVGLRPVMTEPMSEQLTRHYTRVREELSRRREELLEIVSPAYIDRMLEGLGHWISAGQQGYLAWGILKFQVA